MSAIIELERIFRFSGRDLTDPNPAWTPEQCLAHFAHQYSKLFGGKVLPPVHEAGKLVFEMKGLEFGAKG